ncbi:hypothetical protein SAMN05421820_11651 [Pedobacter steynii]|uniref:Uncharacterized protein n=1 Tax=Pedobacter steynii TaxID=430522 RepID=A0A1H0KGX0_9SPHI|nr:hypothetical protein [Pedobacter steynii]NQX43288.1 hypothetical protein [Pedobacter steynii]SDO55167.1 hypothetical protein SAMN05421820_11651 [Pedobacter steynii]
MGFEYKIKADFTTGQIQEIAGLLERNPYFEKKYSFQGKENRQFRHPENKGQMPNLIVIFEIDGIYICQFAASFLWTGLEVLKSYLDSNGITYIITDYQE